MGFLGTEDDARLARSLLEANSRNVRRQVLDQLFVALRAPVFQFCRRLTGNGSDAQDLLQDCFYAMLIGLTQFRGESTISTWAFRIVTRTAFHYRSKRKPFAPLADALDVPAPGAGPEREASARQTSERVARAYLALSRPHQVVLALFAVDGLTQVEIAAVLGVPVGTVWSRLHLARQRLIEQLGPGGV